VYCLLKRWAMKARKQRPRSLIRRTCPQLKSRTNRLLAVAGGKVAPEITLIISLSNLDSGKVGGAACSSESRSPALLPSVSTPPTSLHPVERDFLEGKAHRSVDDLIRSCHQLPIVDLPSIPPHEKPKIGLLIY